MKNSNNRNLSIKQRVDAKMNEHTAELKAKIKSLKEARGLTAQQSLVAREKWTRLEQELAALNDPHSFYYASAMRAFQDDIEFEDRNQDRADEAFVAGLSATAAAAKEKRDNAITDLLGNAIVQIPWSKSDNEPLPGFVRTSDLKRIAGRLVEGEGSKDNNGHLSIRFSPAGAGNTVYVAALIPNGRLAFYAENIDLSGDGGEGSNGE